MATAVVAHRGADVVRNRIDTAQQCVDALAEELGMFTQGVVEVGDVGLMMLAVVDLHGLRVDMRLECGEVVRQLGEHVSCFSSSRLSHRSAFPKSVVLK